jgi:hypothetical protein
MDSYIPLTTYLMAHNDEDGSYSRFSVKLNACVPSRGYESGTASPIPPQHRLL